MSRPGVGLVEDRQLRLEQRHLEDLVALLLAAREAFVDGPAEHPLVDVEQPRLLLDELHELHRVELGQALVLALRVQRGLEEVGVVDAGDFHRVLEGHEHALARALVGIHVEQIVPLVGHVAAGDLVFRMAREDARQGALAGAVRAHDGVHFAGVHVQIDPSQDLFVFGANFQISYIKHFLVVVGPHPHTCQPSLSLGPLIRSNRVELGYPTGRQSIYPTEPSSDTDSSFCASTANSIGSSRKTSLQKPLTIMLIASSSVSPRWRR